MISTVKIDNQATELLQYIMKELTELALSLCSLCDTVDLEIFKHEIFV